ncbi:MAG: hypothetical protein J6C23_03960 [Clostridia bacterium]|nr:hypothetical protein [Clostridia bacterium]
MKSFLIDVGSTFIKYAVYNLSNNMSEFEDAIPFPPACYCEESAYHVDIEDVDRVIDTVFPLAKVYGCKSIYISVQMHGYVLKTKEGFGRYVSWRDWTADVDDTRFLELDFDDLGTSRRKNSPLLKLAYKDVEGEFFTLGSYIAYKLVGVNATHVTDACASGFFFADTGKSNTYAPKLVKPSVYTRVCTVGKYGDISVFTPMGDHQISFWGSNAIDEKYLINIGTAIQISCISEDSKECGRYEKRPYFDKKRLCTLSLSVGGGDVNEEQCKEALWKEIDGALLCLPQKGGAILGGGGADFVFDYLSNRLKSRGITCEKSDVNIGMEGLKKMAKQTAVKKGTMLSEICFPNFMVIAKNCGLDYVILDNEHGYFDYADIAKITMTAKLVGIDLIVRIGDSGRAHITKLADMGVSGFLLPMTNGPEDIARVVECAKYAPEGKRGLSTTRAHTLYNPPPLKEYLPSANQKMKIYAQIETVKGVDNVADILAVEGVDGIFIGPNDLMSDLGCGYDKTALYPIIEKIGSLSKVANKPFGIITGDKELIGKARDNGVTFLSIGSELNMLINGCKKIMEE